MFKEGDFCKCNSSAGVYSVVDDFGYWMYCDDCDRPIEDEYYYDSDPVLY